MMFRTHVLIDKIFYEEILFHEFATHMLSPVDWIYSGKSWISLLDINDRVVQCALDLALPNSVRMRVENSLFLLI